MSGHEPRQKTPRSTNSVNGVEFTTLVGVICRYSGEMEADKPRGNGILVHPSSHDRRSFINVTQEISMTTFKMDRVLWLIIQVRSIKENGF